MISSTQNTLSYETYLLPLYKGPLLTNEGTEYHCNFLTSQSQPSTYKQSLLSVCLL